MGLLIENRDPRSYQYYDTPDGEDCLKKLWFVTKYSGMYGLGASALDILLYSHPKSYPHAFSRCLYITLPFMGIGAAFAATTCLATNVRKKDDKLNYAMGGYAAGAVMGAWKKSIRVGVYGGLGLALAAALKKDSIENNWSFLGDPAPQKYGDFWSIQRDFSILKDPGLAVKEIK